jgi:hypothetical protein
MGAKVVALGSGRFDVYILDGGLPGAGWAAAKSRTRLKGGRKAGKITFGDDAGKTTAILENDLFSLTAVNGSKH